MGAQVWEMQGLAEGLFGRDDAWYVPAGNSPSPLFFVSDRNTGLEIVCFLSVLNWWKYGT
jgi:hypothetical protein